MQFENSLAFARSLDDNDILKAFRKQFIIPVHDGKEQIYFLGNSLGLQPVRTHAYMQQILDAWSKYGVEGFFMGEDPWMNYHDSLTGTLSTVVGALPHEVVVMNQLTVNLHLMMVSFYRPQGRRNKIICEAKAFPSDQYMFETHIKHHGFNPQDILIEVGPRSGERHIRVEDIFATIDKHKDELALVLWGGINYYTGQLFDMEAITKAAHAAGAMVGFDLAHAAGNVPLALHNWDVDFACWCSYKYLNSGPGGVGGAYVHERYHKDMELPRFAGWWGYDKQTRFLMQQGFKPTQTAEGWQLSTPAMLLQACHKAALDVIREAGWENIQQKRKLLNAWLWFLLNDINEKEGNLLEIITPQGENDKGCQISMHMLKNGKQVFDKLTAAGIITDWREPNVIRLAPVPLYNTFEEVWQFNNILRQILQQPA